MRPSLRRSLVRTAGVCLAAAMALSGCSFSPWASDADRGTIRQLDGSTTPWQDCSDQARRDMGGLPSGYTYSCAKLRVPQDWAQPNSKAIALALMRARKTHQDHRIGSLIVNPGGPGGSGVELAAQASVFLPEDVRNRFDIVGFDPRGVADSAPVSCISDRQKDAQIEEDPNPGPAALTEQTRLATSIARACKDKYGDALKDYSTEQTARDMDAVRAAVGDAKLSYLGYSYGTLLGAVYAKLYGPNIRAMVLDGAVDPTLNSVDTSRQQAAGFEKEFDTFAAHCRSEGGGCKSGPDPRATMQRILARAAANPVRNSDGRKATQGVVISAALSALYTTAHWSDLDSALHALDADHQPGQVFSLVDQYFGRNSRGTYDNSSDAELAISCTDDPNPPSVDRINQLRTQWQEQYPLFGSALASSLLGCATWQGAHDPYRVGAATGAPPIVVVGTTGDPATPYGNAQKLAQIVGTGTVVTWQGDGHTAYPQSGCLNNTINDYLINLRTPDSNTRC